ncbi:hypothetical protein SAMN05216490_0633 [Mucilaginibacter mallensis]|uniref:CarboxypepD_reg-like domain-containing protein n=1 Tax=Mucilaginibacter mallensis TaxID=652787 RepID=A0A1H1PX46_MUCMA|nr:hypothetical protein [Mucilaginibacter mallensis]SDS15259.1 hypothetical protein SAMN05216490_0633 [Mucilaginibacter mallensis]
MTLNPKRLSQLLLLFLLIFSIKLSAQGYLMKEVAIKEIKQQPIASILNKISSKQDFYFAYNNRIIPADSLVSVSGFRGTIFSLLEQLLGENYEFKEVPGYIVLTFAPDKLTLTAEISKDQGTPTLVRGYVRDIADSKAITHASVYEKDLLVSTLTNDKGYFELKLRNYNGSVKLTASKENYRDTSLFVLADVVVNDKQINKSYNYYPDNGSNKGIEHSRFARFFISSKQLVQDLNLGNFFAASPYQISLTPGLSTHGMYSSQVIDHFSLNLLGGYTAGIDGVELAGVFNINRKSMRFLQVAGIFNVVGDSTRGIQMAGIYNNVLNNARGIQIGGGVNQSRNFSSGIQMAGFANFDKTAKGLQVAGVMNKYNTGKGATVAGLTNMARDSSGTQIAGFLNMGGDVGGLQVAGFMNVAKKVKGPQIGFINIADSSDYPIGIINFIKNGGKSIALSSDENLYAHIDFRSGGKVLYSLLGIGYRFGSDKDKYLLDVGLGAHIVNNKRFFLDAEYVNSSSLNTNPKKDVYHTNSLKVLPGYKISKHLGLFAGPSINLTSLQAGDADKVHGWVIENSINNNHINTTSIGITSGLQFMW